jgi:membrane-associated phospholipid phosphatase
MLKKLHLIILGISFFFFFIFFSYLVHKDIFKQIDFDTTVYLQDHIPRRVDGIFSVLSEIGKFEVMLVLLIITLVFTRKIIAGLAALFLFAGFHVIELYGKFFVDHLPPPEFMLRTKHLVDFPQFHVRSEFSYPSGHAGRAAFLSIILVVLILQNRRLSPTWKIVLCFTVVGYDLCMFVSRVYLGEHWSTDVVGGGILGLSLGLLSGVLLVGKGLKLEIKKVE